jgi:hypothetical protein
VIVEKTDNFLPVAVAISLKLNDEPNVRKFRIEREDP